MAGHITLLRFYVEMVMLFELVRTLTRQYKDGTWASHMHAEMNVLRFAKPGDEIEVMRFTACGKHMTMARPCPLCEAEIRKAGIKRVRYTNWEGEWEELKPMAR